MSVTFPRARARPAPRRARYRLGRGLDLRLPGAPEPHVDALPRAVRSVALVCADFIGQRLTPRVEPGQRVQLAETLAVDRDRPEIRHTSPGAGVVRALTRGKRRRLLSIEVELAAADDGADERRFDATSPSDLDALSADDVKARLLDSGLWTALRARPFERVPDPATTPHSIFVTALDSAPLAAPAEVVLAAHHADFADGLRVLTRLTPGPVHLCRRAGAAIPGAELEGVQVSDFSGPHPAGLAGTHIHLLDPVGPQRSVWHVGCQDVVAMGHLFTTGRLQVERCVALAGPRVTRPRVLRTRLGACIDELVAGELRPGLCRVVSGSPLSGRQASSWGRHLGRYHTQVCVLEEHGGERGGWFRRRRASTALHGRPSVFIPTHDFERVMPLRLMATPLLRALVVGDIQLAQQLGCLELAEEDLALCSYVCPGKLEYGGLLRAALERLERES